MKRSKFADEQINELLIEHWVLHCSLIQPDRALGCRPPAADTIVLAD